MLPVVSWKWPLPLTNQSWFSAGRRVVPKYQETSRWNRFPTGRPVPTWYENRRTGDVSEWKRFGSGPRVPPEMTGGVDGEGVRIGGEGMNTRSSWNCHNNIRSRDRSCAHLRF